MNMHARVNLKCPEHGQGSWVARVRVGEDASVEILGYADSTLLQEKIARALADYIRDSTDEELLHPDYAGRGDEARMPLVHSFDTVAERIVEEAFDYSVTASTEFDPTMTRARIHTVHVERASDPLIPDGSPIEISAPMEGPFDPDELVRWAETYGHPEEWAQKAKAANEHLEEALERREEALEERECYFHALEDIDALIALWKPSERTGKIEAILKEVLYTKPDQAGG
jgi:hypothetical protein